MIPTQNPAAYYADLTRQYGRYAGRARGWHYGIWEHDIRNHQQALVRSNEILLRGLTISPATHILDVGMGAGGFAVWAATRFGCRVTGITVCAPHVDLARGLARQAGVADRCEFHEMDMDALSFQDGRFDCVVNQDTLCHAADKPAYLASVARALRPGGTWRAIDFSIQEAPFSPSQQRDYDAACDGFHMPSMVAPSTVTTALAAARFHNLEVVDYTPQVWRAARLILRQCYGPLALEALGLDWVIFSRDADRLRNRRGHIAAAVAYSRGLLHRYFRHMFYSGSSSKTPGGLA